MRHGIGWTLQIGVRAFWATAVRPPWSTGYAAAFSGADYARPTRAPEGQRSGLDAYRAIGHMSPGTCHPGGGEH